MVVIVLVDRVAMCGKGDSVVWYRIELVAQRSSKVVSCICETLRPDVGHR